MKLLDVCELIVDCPHSTAADEGKGYPLIRTPNIGKGRLLLEGVHRVSRQVYDNRNVRAVPKENDLILAREAPVGNVAIVQKGQEVCLGQRTVLIRPDINFVEPNYLVNLLLSPQVQYVLHNSSNGATVSHLNMSDIRALEIQLPTMEVQRKVGHCLSVIDDKIEANKRINDNLYQQVAALYTSLFGHTMGKTTVSHYSKQIYSGGTPSTSKSEFWGGPLHWFSSGETRDKFVITTEKTITQAAVDNSSTRLAHKYDVVMASAGQGLTRGQTSMLLLDTYVNQSVIVIHADYQYLPYIFWNLASRYDELRAISDSSSIRGSLTTKMLSSFEMPEVEMQSLIAFSDFAWSVIPEIEKNMLENERLYLLRDTLLPRLMSGEIDVSDVAI